MVRLRLTGADCGGDSPSLTVTPTVNVPVSLGAPVIVSVPPAALADTPGGSPDTADHV